MHPIVLNILILVLFIMCNYKYLEYGFTNNLKIYVIEYKESLTLMINTKLKKSFQKITNKKKYDFIKIRI